MKSFVKMVFIFLLALPLVGQANHSWNGYHWARIKPNLIEFPNNPYRFDLKVVDNLTPDWKTSLDIAKGDWNTPQKFDLVPFNNLTTPVNLVVVNGFYPNKKCNTVTGTTQVCNSAYGRNGWLGLATIYITGGVHITKGTAKMNDSYFNSNFPKYNNPNERLHVLCQEVAHTFGLGHQSENFNLSLDTCMDYSSSTPDDDSSSHPNEHDFVMLNSIYNHYDSFNSYSTTSTPALAMGPDPVDHGDPNSWGQLVSQSRDGRSSTYERVHGPQSKSVTEVYWTEETAEDCRSCDHRFHHDEE
jgi:hypothetical protein